MASVAKCWRQNPQISLSRGVVLSHSAFYLVIYLQLQLQLMTVRYYTAES